MADSDRAGSSPDQRPQQAPQVHPPVETPFDVGVFPGWAPGLMEVWKHRGVYHLHVTWQTTDDDEPRTFLEHHVIQDTKWWWPAAVHISLADKKVMVKWRHRGNPKVGEAGAGAAPLEEQMEQLGLEQPPLVLRQTTEKTEITMATPTNRVLRAEEISSGESTASRSRSLSPKRGEEEDIIHGLPCLGKERPGPWQGQA